MNPATVRRVASRVMAALVAGLGLWGAFAWSMIPAGVEGRVVDVAHYSETGYRFRVFTLDDGRSMVVDRQIEIDLHAHFDGGGARGRTIRTDAWSRTLHVDDHAYTLAPSTAFWQVTVALGALCFLGLRPWRAPRADAATRQDTGTSPAMADQDTR